MKVDCGMPRPFMNIISPMFVVQIYTVTVQCPVHVIVHCSHSLPYTHLSHRYYSLYFNSLNQQAESAPPPGKDKKSKKPQPLPPGVEEEESPTGLDSGLEVIEEVNMDDINNMDIEDQEEEDNSLAAAAAAYAQCRSTIGSTTTEGLGLSESEVAVVSVLAAFLTVHPLGATINEITVYFHGFNPTYNSYYLESLLQRLSKVFQLSGGKWWFLGFQTCYTAVSEKQTNTATTAEGQGEDDHES